MSSISLKKDDSIDKRLRDFKKVVDKSGVLRAAKAHRFYDKPSVRKRAKSKAALKYKR